MKCGSDGNFINLFLVDGKYQSLSSLVGLLINISSSSSREKTTSSFFQEDALKKHLIWLKVQVLQFSRGKRGQNRAEETSFGGSHLRLVSVLETTYSYFQGEIGQGAHYLVEEPAVFGRFIIFFGKKTVGRAFEGALSREPCTCFYLHSWALKDRRPLKNTDNGCQRFCIASLATAYPSKKFSNRITVRPSRSRYNIPCRTLLHHICP